MGKSLAITEEEAAPATDYRSRFANFQINPKTGFLENPAFAYDFDSDRKMQYLELIRKGYGKYKACDAIHVKHSTVFNHLQRDEVFRQAVVAAEKQYVDDLETVSRNNALEPKMVIERIFQLKHLLPGKYGDLQNVAPSKVTINIDGKNIELISEREKVLDAEVIKKAEEAGQIPVNLPLSVDGENTRSDSA